MSNACAECVHGLNPDDYYPHGLCPSCQKEYRRANDIVVCTNCCADVNGDEADYGEDGTEYPLCEECVKKQCRT